jgi:hypothetical protein
MGILSTAGALGGIGQGITEAGQQAQKMSMAERINDLQQAREEAIERLRGGEQEKLQAKGQEFEKGQTEAKIGAASRAAGSTREFEHTENVAKEAAAQKRTETTGEYRVQARQVGVADKGPGKIWIPSKLSQGGFDPASKLPTTKQLQLMNNSLSGAAYVQQPAGWVRALSDGTPKYRPEQLRRAQPEEVQQLLAHPMDVVPEGHANSGMSYADAFEQAHGYLPEQWSGAAERADAAAKQSGKKLGISIPSYQPGKSDNSDDGPADNAAQSQADTDNAAPSFQSQAMNSYSANSQ